jgi:hypothetical protein
MPNTAEPTTGCGTGEQAILSVLIHSFAALPAGRKTGLPEPSRALGRPRKSGAKRPDDLSGLVHSALLEIAVSRDFGASAALLARGG